MPWLPMNSKFFGGERYVSVHYAHIWKIIRINEYLKLKTGTKRLNEYYVKNTF